ncbi:MAG: DUF2182 domain-containing protein [Longimicrobiales bacterium]|nr:DUF2182 domain-containing protein [Longimicrobiales bacterium]
MAMMLAMMIPSVYPWVVSFSSLSKAGHVGSIKPTWVLLFILGYVAIWSGFSLTLMFSHLQLDAMLSRVSTSGKDFYSWASPWILISVGLYQLTPIKNACLKHCRSPFHYFLTKWKNGPRGALLMGISHGAFCLGCCWALMLAMFFLGLMNLVWMILFTLIVSVENLLPQGEFFAKFVGIGMTGWGITLILGS